jgi:anti-sigma factor RsiW
MTSERPITEDDLQAFVDGTLDVARHAEVTAYLHAHPDTACRIEAMAGQRHALRALYAPVAAGPVPLELSLERMLLERRRPRAGLPVWAAAVAALALLALGGGGGWLARGALLASPNGVAALAREAAYSYAVFGTGRIRPVEIAAGNRDMLIRWLSRRLQHPVSAPDLSASGFRLLGGRLVATPHGPAALFMYDNGGLRIAMMVRPMSVPGAEPMMAHSQGAVNGFSWADNGIGYSVVGPDSPALLHPLANEVRRQMKKSA